MRGPSAQVHAHNALTRAQEAHKELYEHTQGGRQAIAGNTGLVRVRSAQVHAHIPLTSTQEADKEEDEHTQEGRQAVAETLGSCVCAVHRCTPTLL